MKRVSVLLLLLGCCCLAHPADAKEPTALAFDTYSGYFVSNKFEPDAAESFVLLESQKAFDEVFGVAFVMRDTSHRLPKDAFEKSLVLGAVKRGKAMWKFKVERVTELDGVVQLEYTATSKPSDSATFACPLIVSIPKSDYREIHFVENGKTIKKLAVEKKPSP